MFFLRLDLENNPFCHVHLKASVHGPRLTSLPLPEETSFVLHFLWQLQSTFNLANWNLSGWLTAEGIISGSSNPGTRDVRQERTIANWNCHSEKFCIHQHWHLHQRGIQEYVLNSSLFQANRENESTVQQISCKKILTNSYCCFGIYFFEVPNLLIT